MKYIEIQEISLVIWYCRIEISKVERRLDDFYLIFMIYWWLQKILMIKTLLLVYFLETKYVSVWLEYCDAVFEYWFEQLGSVVCMLMWNQ